MANDNRYGNAKEQDNSPGAPKPGAAKDADLKPAAPKPVPDQDPKEK